MNEFKILFSIHSNSNLLFPDAARDLQYKIIYDDLVYERWPYDKRSVTHYRRTYFAIHDKDEVCYQLQIFCETKSYVEHSGVGGFVSKTKSWDFEWISYIIGGN